MFAAINSLLSMLLIATDHLWSLFKIYAVSLAVLFLGIYLTVDTFGSVGLAWSVVASKATTSLGLLTYIGRDTLRIAGFRSILGATAMAIAMALVFSTLSSFSIVARYGFTFAAGLITLLVFRGVGSDDIQRLRQIVGK
jgi:O-antigen/teichoic acid export membrane protein